jgi:aminopeptidase N
MSRRLDAIARDLAEQLEREPVPRLRRVAERVALAALGEVPVEDDRVDRAVAALRAARFGETSERAALKALVDELDEAAWNMQDEVEAGQADQADYLAAFGRARAAMALWFALDGDPLEAAMEAAYEAEAATDERLLRHEIAAA